MIRKLGALVRAGSLCGLFALCAAAVPAQLALPYQLSGDVSESYRLLTTTYYNPVDPQVLLSAASAALVSAAKKRGVTIAAPQLSVQPDRDATVAALGEAIADAAHASGAPPADFAYAAIVAMAKAVNDRYTQFFTPAEFKAFNTSLDPEKIGGIGVIIEPDPTTQRVRVTYVVPSTPAERAGLQVGDVVTLVDGVSTKGLGVEAVSAHLRGKPGTVVNVTVMRGSSPVQTAKVSITREDVQPPTVVYKMLPGDIGYVWVIAFGRATPAEFDNGGGSAKHAGRQGAHPRSAQRRRRLRELRARHQFALHREQGDRHGRGARTEARRRLTPIPTRPSPCR